MDSEINTLQQLKHQISVMGGYVEKALEEATYALIARKAEHLDNIDNIEKKINEIHVVIDAACFKLLAKLSPFASDLRLILACFKMNNDLERMGDHARNISLGTRMYLSRKEIPLEKDFLQMTNEARWMVKTALDAFVTKDASKAQKVLEHDDVVDQLKDRLTLQMKDLIKKDPDFVESGVDLILFSRNLERIGDLATNIAEDVIFIASGDDVRHGGIAVDG